MASITGYHSSFVSGPWYNATRLAPGICKTGLKRAILALVCECTLMTMSVHVMPCQYPVHNMPASLLVSIAAVSLVCGVCNMPVQYRSSIFMTFVGFFIPFAHFAVAMNIVPYRMRWHSVLLSFALLHGCMCAHKIKGQEDFPFHECCLF